MTEPQLVRKIKEALIAEGAYAAKIHGGQYSVGVPDLLVCHRCKFFGFEVKLPGKEKNLTRLQEKNLRSIREAGGYGWVITTVEEALEIIEHVPMQTRSNVYGDSC
jgi:hypothetical protein